jgi:hypothetical protein
MRSGMSWARTYEWVGIFIALVLVMLVYFGAVSFVSRVALGSIVAILGYLAFVVALAWGFGWVMGDSRRARAFLALRRVIMGNGSHDDIGMLEQGPAAYR